GRPVHVLHHGCRDPEDDPGPRLGPGRGVRRGQRGRRLRRHLPGDGHGPPSAGARMSVLVWVAVVIIGGAGSVLRFLVDRAVASRARRDFPFGTLVTNLSGALIRGFLTGLALGKDQALLAGTAAVGSYTTFSTWILETERLAEDRELGRAAANVAVSLLLGVAAAALGQWIGG